MERNIALTVLGFALLAIAIAILAPGGRQLDPTPKLPWDITVHPDGSSTIFTLTLGSSTVEEASQLLDDEGELTLFAAEDGELTLEIFFERVALSGLRADVVMTLDLPQEALQPVYDRGTRAAKLGSGETKVTLNPADETAVRDAPIRHITYIPIADLEADLLESRFGAPDQRIPANNDVVHWLYPERGLDIAVDPKRREVFQYVAPKDFTRLVEEPLERAAAERAAKAEAAEAAQNEAN